MNCVKGHEFNAPIIEAWLEKVTNPNYLNATMSTSPFFPDNQRVVLALRCPICHDVIPQEFKADE